MILSKVYEDAERKLERNEITLGEFERLVDIEVIEPKRGEWIISYADDYGIRKTECSACGASFITYDVYGWDYCPWCGARMKGKDNE